MSVATLAPAGPALLGRGGDDMLTTVGRLAAFAGVMTWSGWSPPFSGTANGSELVAALERAYAAVRAEVPDLPDVVIITGSGLSGAGLTWGHFRRDAWVDALASGQVPEVFLGAELLAQGARRVMRTMLHECAHILAFVRDIDDTSRQHRYHNMRFVKLARSLGLDYLHEEADPTIGFSDVDFTPDGARRWAPVIADLHRTLTLAGDLPDWLARLLGILGTGGGAAGGGASGGAAGGAGGGHGLRVVGRGKGTGGSSSVRIVCPECNRIARVSRGQLDRGPIGCGNEDDHPADAPAFVVMVET